MNPQTTYTSSYTEDQRRIVEMPAQTLLAVTAAAGTGKTHTMVGRIGHLLAEEDLRPYEILVLSFARSAVRELKTRLAAAGEAGRLVSARTFDSWALDLLTEYEAGTDWRTISFDGRIENAARLVRSGAADERLTEVGHLVIDEAQDVVGARLDFVKGIIENTDSGFTIVGDAAQSIYGFQIESDEERRRGADLLFGWLRAHFGDELTEMNLDRNFRAGTAEASTALEFGQKLRRSAEDSTSASGAFAELRTALLGVFDVGTLTDPLVCQDLGADESGTTAVLCRTNGEVLLASEQFAAAGVPHAVQRIAEDRTSPSWLATLIRQAPSLTVDRMTFDRLVGPSLPRHQDAELAWSLLARHHGDRRRIDLSRLRRAISEQRLPDELTSQPPADLVISTFHRAKGLEFDRVVVMDPGLLSENALDAPEEEEARLLYVAMTRSRAELMRTDSLKSWDVRSDNAVGRYARFGFKNWQRLGMEALAGDVSTTDPPGPSGRAAEIQARLLSEVSPGDPVVLERLGLDGTVDGESPEYLVIHHDVAIAKVSETFRRSLYRLLGGRPSYGPRSFPRRIVGLRIDGVETVSGSTASGAIAGLGDRGVWLAPCLVGLSRFEFDRKDADA